MQTALHAASPRYSSRPVPTFHPSKAPHAKRHSEPVVALSSSSKGHKSKSHTHGHSLSDASASGRSLLAGSRNGTASNLPAAVDANRSSHEVRTPNGVGVGVGVEAGVDRGAASELASKSSNRTGKKVGGRRLSEELFSSDVQHLLDELNPKSHGECFAVSHSLLKSHGECFVPYLIPC